MMSVKSGWEPKPESGYMSRRQVAEMFGISVSMLNSLPKSSLPFYKVGRKVLYRRQEVEAWIEGRNSQSTTTVVLGLNRRPGRPAKKAL